MARFLVTGAAGFIGSHLCERLVGRGDEVTGLDNFDPFYDPSRKERNLAALLASPRFRLVRGDIRDATLLSRLVPGSDAVVHLAARAGVRPSIRDPGLYQRVNVEGTLTLLEACRAHGVGRFVFASSSSVYGGNTKVPFSEEDRVDEPVSPYAATKRAGELLGYTYAHLFGMTVTCLRFFTVYGPRQRPEMAIHLFTRALWEGKPITVFGDGTSARDYTFIDDIIQGTIAALERGAGFRIYNLGESRRVPMRELIALLEKRTGQAAILEHEPDQPGDVPVTYADVTRARAELDYDPRVAIDEGIGRFVAWFRAEEERGS
jgi:UDP-glucuronate 4-epimerase